MKFLRWLNYPETGTITNYYPDVLLFKETIFYVANLNLLQNYGFLPKNKEFYSFFLLFSNFVSNFVPVITTNLNL
jgi:hypothetical protein